MGETAASGMVVLVLSAAVLVIVIEQQNDVGRPIEYEYEHETKRE